MCNHLMEFIIYLIYQGINKDPFASSVTPLFLEAASKYPIIFEVYYADSFYATEQDDTFATLSWECAEVIINL